MIDSLQGLFSRVLWPSKDCHFTQPVDFHGIELPSYILPEVDHLDLGVKASVVREPERFIAIAHTDELSKAKYF